LKIIGSLTPHPLAHVASLASGCARAAACGPGRPDLLRCCQGGLACLANARVRARRRPVWPEEPEQALPG